MASLRHMLVNFGGSSVRIGLKAVIVRKPSPRFLCLSFITPHGRCRGVGWGGGDLLHGDRGDELHIHSDVVAGHNHLGVAEELNCASDVGSAEEELRLVVLEEGGVAPALLLGKAVHLGLKLGRNRCGARLGEHLAARNVLPLETAEQDADIVPGLSVGKALLEHLDASAGALLGCLEPHNLELLPNLMRGLGLRVYDNLELLPNLMRGLGCRVYDKGL